MPTENERKMQQLFSSSKRSVDLDDMDDPSAGTNDRCVLPEREHASLGFFRATFVASARVSGEKFRLRYTYSWQIHSWQKEKLYRRPSADLPSSPSRRSRQGGVDAKVHKKLKGGMRRVDSVELAKLRIPQAVRSNKKRGTSRMMRERQAGASRGNGGSGGSLSFMGIGGGVGEMIKS